MLFAFGISPQANAAGTDWEVVESDDGITTWKREVPGQVFPVVKGEVIIDARLDKVRQTVEDWTQHKTWMHRCTASDVVERVGDSEALLYNRTDSPWPVKDRDVVYRMKRQIVKPDQEIILNFASEKSTTKPSPDGVVRMPRMNGYYKLVRVDANKTKVIYELDIDVGGSLPNWLVKSMVAELPRQTLTGLRKRSTK